MPTATPPPPTRATPVVAAVRDELLLCHLAKGCGLVEAARLARMDRSTARRRAADPGFRMRLDALLAEVRARTVARLADPDAPAPTEDPPCPSP